MKNKGFLLLLIFALLIISSLGVMAADLSDIEGRLEEVEGIKDILADESTRTDYLKQQWNEIFKNSWLKGPLDFVDSFFSFLNPVWEIVLGMSFSLSFDFVLTFILWILFLVFAFRIFSVFEPLAKPLGYAVYYKWGIFLVFFVFISSIRIPKSISETIISFISEKGELQFQLISALFVVFCMVVAIVFSKQIGSIAKFSKRLKRIENLEEKSDIREKRIKVMKNKIESMEKESEKRELSEEEKKEFDRLVKEYTDAVQLYDVRNLTYKTKGKTYDV